MSILYVSSRGTAGPARAESLPTILEYHICMLKRGWILSFRIPALLPAALLRIEVSERERCAGRQGFRLRRPL